MTTTLVTVRYPLTADSYRTIERGLDAHDEGDSLIVLHISLLQNGDRISRSDLQAAVEAEFGEIPAHYVVRRGYVLEEAIVDEAARQNADHVLVGKTKRGRLRRRVAQLLGLYPDLEAELAESLGTRLEIVA
ncbi:universal stress protein [Halonotius terrestris]|uniref:Universal stress protein n=1 Tax=Halonotius terrestris TaxID=2487750 RepID=A0A8J8P996_9EURY|nr:universal stress protein [Halonotius terrestris]TQQ80955.1 universal stress protein [Halonotius terrestris]